jgi:hypothetical protein
MDYVELFEDAKQAGLRAAIDAKPPKVYVSGFPDPIDGVCGRAYIVFPANQSFIRAMKGAGIAGPVNSHMEITKRAFASGYIFSPYMATQSMERYRAYCMAMVIMLTDHGVKCWMGTWMD